MVPDSGSGVTFLLRRPFFVAAVVVYALLQLGHRILLWYPPSWVTAWLADLLCMPVVLTLALAVQRLVRQQPQFVLPTSWMFGAWLSFSLWFEWLAPYWQPARYTADWLDVIAYGLGTLFFARWLNRRIGTP